MLRHVPHTATALCCNRCWNEWAEKQGPDAFFNQRMILCIQCGNKRCPKASDHRLDCTGSNEPGQEGSIYA